MSKITNYSGSELVNSSYYSVQFGPFITIAFYSDDSWFIPGVLPTTSSKIKEDLIVIELLTTQDKITLQYPSPVLELTNSSYYIITYGLTLTIGYFANNQWFVPGCLPLSLQDANNNLVVVNQFNYFNYRNSL